MSLVFCEYAPHNLIVSAKCRVNLRLRGRDFVDLLEVLEGRLRYLHLPTILFQKGRRLHQVLLLSRLRREEVVL